MYYGARRENNSGDEGISFNVKLLGYVKDDVDRYIKSLAEAYQTAYDEYNQKCEEYNELLDYSKKLEIKDNSKQNGDVSAQTMTDAEKMANKIIELARNEAERIKEDAYLEMFRAKIAAQKTIDDANAEATEAVKAAKMLYDSTIAEAEASGEEARRIVDEAHTEAQKLISKVHLDSEQINDVLTQVIGELQSLMSTGLLDDLNR